MEKIVGDYLSSIELGDLQQHKNMAVFPLFTSSNHGPEYLTLKEALALGVLAITEISEGGSVSQPQGNQQGGSPHPPSGRRRTCRGKAEQGAQHNDSPQGTL